MTRLGNTFGRMMATMDREAPSAQTRRFLGKRSREPHAFFGFIAYTAIEWLEENEELEHDNAVKLLERFIEARLLHFPDDRMCLHVRNDDVQMQPTAKGFAYIEEWFRGNASYVTTAQREFLMSALASSYNSMELVRLERSLLSENLLVSTGLAMWLWQRMLGEKPNLFDGTIRKENKQTMRRHALAVFNTNSLDLTSVLPLTDGTPDLVQTPFWSGAMIHPSSSSAMQYWDSRGMRLFKSLEFERPLKSKFAGAEQYTVSMCLSGKAMWQWIMECTTVEKMSEAAKIVRVFIDQRFVEPITDRLLSWATYKDDLPAVISRLTFYRFTQRGIRLCAWEHMIDVTAVKPSSFDQDEVNAIRWMLSGGPSQSERADERTWAWTFTERAMTVGQDDCFKQLVTLDLINREPALKVPFRKKLIEWHCEENLRYVEDSQRVLLLLKAGNSAHGTVTRLERLQSQVVTGAFELRRLYIQPGSPFQLNISHDLRDKFLGVVHDGTEVQDLLRHIETPLQEIQTECMILLRQQVSKFLLEDELRHLPLSSYIVGCYKQCR